MVGVKGTIVYVVLEFLPELRTAPEVIKMESFTYLVLKTFLMVQVKAKVFKCKRSSNPDPMPEPEPVLKAVLRIKVNVAFVNVVPLFFPEPYTADKFTEIESFKSLKLFMLYLKNILIRFPNSCRVVRIRFHVHDSTYGR